MFLLFPGKLNVVGLGPLTNLALAIKSDPQFAGNLQQLYIMGGNFTGWLSIDDFK
jgi:purine nucleosidase